MRDVYFIPSWSLNELSCSRVNERGIRALIAHMKCMFFYHKQQNRLISVVYLDAKVRLYALRILVCRRGQTKRVTPMKFNGCNLRKNARSRRTSSELWNRGSWHPNNKVVLEMIRQKHYGMDVNDNPKAQSCKSCALTKEWRDSSGRQLIKHSEQITTHSDTCEPICLQTYVGKIYFLTMTTTSQRYAETKLLSYQSDAMKNFFNYMAWLAKNIRQKVKRNLSGTPMSSCSRVIRWKIWELLERYLQLIALSQID